MHQRRCVWLTAILLLVVLVATGCSRRTPPPAAPPPPAPPPAATKPAPPPPPPAPPPAPPAQPPQTQKPLSEDEIFAKKTVDELNAERVLADVLFDYDSSVLRDDGRSAASRNADYLKRWPSVRITVEGHADSRGTSEYNLALGERRAAAVKDYIVSLGVQGDRITTVSKGKEQPVCTEASEACWQRNRRGFNIITAK